MKTSATLREIRTHFQDGVKMDIAAANAETARQAYEQMIDLDEDESWRTRKDPTYLDTLAAEGAAENKARFQQLGCIA